jgi:hypothetical protein
MGGPVLAEFNSQHMIADAEQLKAVIDAQTMAIRGASDLTVHIATAVDDMPELVAMLVGIYSVEAPAYIN